MNSNMVNQFSDSVQFFSRGQFGQLVDCFGLSLFRTSLLLYLSRFIRHVSRLLVLLWTVKCDYKQMISLSTMKKASKCEKEYHYCHLMFAGECWITKIVTVLVDCKVKAKKCCPGFIEDTTASRGDKIKCIAESGCGGASKLTSRTGSIQSLNYPGKV